MSEIPSAEHLNRRVIDLSQLIRQQYNMLEAYIIGNNKQPEQQTPFIKSVSEAAGKLRIYRDNLMKLHIVEATKLTAMQEASENLLAAEKEAMAAEAALIANKDKLTQAQAKKAAETALIRKELSDTIPTYLRELPAEVTQHWRQKMALRGNGAGNEKDLSAAKMQSMAESFVAYARQANSLSTPLLTIFKSDEDYLAISHLVKQIHEKQAELGKENPHAKPEQQIAEAKNLIAGFKYLFEELQINNPEVLLPENIKTEYARVLRAAAAFNEAADRYFPPDTSRSV